MAELLQYKCPCCGGAVEFNSSSQNMKCPYCDAEFDIEALKASGSEETKEDSAEWSTASECFSDGETVGMKVYMCQSCGGEVVGDESLGATSCPYCGNPVVMKGAFSGELRPDLVIPFKFDKEAAKAALKKHISSKKLLPKVFKDENHIDEIKGIYVPYWLFDCNASGNATYKAEKKRNWSDNDFDYCETSVFRVSRAGNMSFSALPVDGSSKMDDKLLESIEPFNINDGVDFNTAYLSGYLADKYDVESGQCLDRVNERIKKTLEGELQATVRGYDSFSTDYSSMTLRDAQCRYALYPVWILNTTWNGKKYTFAMNGQTGRIVGDLPMDKTAFWKWTGIVTAAAGALSYLAMTALNLF